MPPHPLLCYITDRNQFSGNEHARRQHLLEKIAEATHAGVDYIQLREKDLATRDLESFAREVVRIVGNPQSRSGEQRTVVQINSRTDIALAVGAGGVHLPSHDISPTEPRRIWERSRGRDNSAPATISASCHEPFEVEQAAGADFVLFAPVFEKKEAPPAGLENLRRACAYKVPVLALGGVTLKNAASCLVAGAAGIAAIRLFQENDVAHVVRCLRSL